MHAATPAGRLSAQAMPGPYNGKDGEDESVDLAADFVLRKLAD